MGNVMKEHDGIVQFNDVRSFLINWAEDPNATEAKDLILNAITILDEAKYLFVTNIINSYPRVEV